VEWDRLGEWWIGEVVDDPAYDDDVLPLLLEVFEAPPGPVLDVGCGEGRVMRALGAPIVGTDAAAALLERACTAGPVVKSRLPGLGWLRPGSLSGSVVVLVLEHIADTPRLFTELHRVAAPGGTLTAVMNHPAFTSQGAGPIVDVTDGEVLWRWGTYFSQGTSEEPAGATKVTFHHRPLGQLLTEAAGAGWGLETLKEQPLSPATVARLPSLVGQEHMPRLAGVRWRRR
jgi:SAM-dependent methyltransferase